MKTRGARIWTEQLLFGRSQATRSSATGPPAPFLRSFFSTTQQSAKARLPPKTLQQSALLYFRFQRSAFSRRCRSIRFNSNKSNGSHHDPTPHLGSPEPAQSLSQRLKALSKEYGWAALGVYLGLSALDFPICFLAVRWLGTDRIGHYEEVVKDGFWNLVRLVFPDAGTTSAEKHAQEDNAEATLREGSPDSDEVAAVKARNGGDACKYNSHLYLCLITDWNKAIWTQLGLAYLVHKSLIFFRVPLTAAVLPKVVKTLRKWGYNIGKKKPQID